MVGSSGYRVYRQGSHYCVGILYRFLMISRLSIYMCLTPYPPVLVSPTALVLKLYRYCASPIRILFRLTAYITSQLAGRYNRSRSPTSTSSCDTHSFGCSRCSLSRYSPISFNPKREKPRSVFWKRERRSKL